MSENEPKEDGVSKNPICRFIMVALLLVQASLLAYLSWSTSPNRTEVGHLGAAVYLWNFHKFDVFNVNPPLVRFVAGAPIALFCNPKYDWKGYSPRPQDRCEWKLGNAFIAANELNDLRIYIFLARLACIPLVLLGGYFGFRFASELYGEWSGVVFQILWTFSPLVLGWGATICPDVAAASMGIIGLYTFWHWLKSPTWGKAITAGICLGLMPLTKTTWIIAFPIWFFLWLAWKLATQKKSRQWQFRQFVAVFFVGLYTINTGYLFDGSFRTLNDYTFISGTLSGEKMHKGTLVKPGNRFRGSWLGHVPVALPVEFVQGIDVQKLDFERGIDSYAHGVWSDHGWWWYYIYAFSIKEPIGAIMLALCAVGSCFSNRYRITKHGEIAIIETFIVLLFFISSQTGLSIHYRYAIPAIPFIYIFSSRLAMVECKQFYVITVICLLWIIGSSLSSFPHSMSYFNEFAGKPQCWPNLLQGSNIDWGQDLYALKTWREKNPGAKPLYVLYEPSVPIDKLGIDDASPVPFHPVDGWIVISVNALYDKQDHYRWIKRHKPTTMIGYSLWVFYIADSGSATTQEY